MLPLLLCFIPAQALAHSPICCHCSYQCYLLTLQQTMLLLLLLLLLVSCIAVAIPCTHQLSPLLLLLLTHPVR
jgi:hypothetical protein